MTEREALIALNRIQGIGAITAKRIAGVLGSVAAAGGRSVRELQAIPGVGEERAALIARELTSGQANEEMELAATKGVTLITWVDEGYPALLQTIADPPLVLYVTGDAAALDTPSAAIVGTRHPTLYGREMAQRFSYQLAAAGYTVVSGLAEGIDTEAHTGALKAGGRTVAVLGGGLDCLYPKSNTGLARKIVSEGGAVISEYPFGRQPDRQTFPMRNRIVSGLCKGVLVVEAPVNSGTLITANQALDQNRAVMAVPGRIDSGASQGCHKLLKEGAKLVTRVEDVLEELQDLFGARRGAGAPHDGPLTNTGYPTAKGTDASGQRQGDLGVGHSAVDRGPSDPPAPKLSEEERALLAGVADEGTHMDALIRASGMDAGKVNAIVVSLQIRRQVRLLPGGFVKRV